MSDEYTRLIDGVYVDPRDQRTVPFTAAEFSNTWALHRGKVYPSDHLGTFHEEFRTWLAAHDAGVARRAKAEERERIAGEIDAVIQQVTNDDEAWGLSQAYGIARADHIEADTTWGPYWCPPCDVKRLDRISRNLEALLAPTNGEPR